MTLTKNQRRVLHRAIQTAPEWIIAYDAGERVTLASLYYRGFLEREARRGVAGEPDAAYQYRPTEAVLTSWAEVVRAHKEKGVA